MRKIFLLGLTFLLLGAFLFADDAMVMPRRVGRFYLAPTFISANESFDRDGNRNKMDSMSMFNLGAALEHGVNDWITFALQWAPGMNFWSDFDMKLQNPMTGELSASQIKLEDMGDLVVGAKIQFVGRNAPKRSEKVRLAFAPGIWVPLTTGPDFEKQQENLINGADATLGTLDNHVLGLGLRSYLDYIFNEHFFVNFYNEISYYPIRQEVQKTGYQQFATLQGLNAAFANFGTEIEGLTNHVYDLTFEIEPRYTRHIVQGTVLEIGLPVTYKTVPEIEYSFGATGPAADMAVDAAKNAFLGMSERSQLLAVNPGIAIFFMNWTMPIQFKLTYSVPVWGENTSANNVLGMQARFYYRI
ncbi:MAG: hypothetical protein FWG98_03735 [Candidatus Cloacimonetes bacterium]|nr:hypothetical protein [Candidatus Cloacimonadota bacterium]